MIGVGGSEHARGASERHHRLGVRAFAILIGLVVALSASLGIGVRSAAAQTCSVVYGTTESSGSRTLTSLLVNQTGGSQRIYGTVTTAANNLQTACGVQATNFSAILPTVGTTRMTGNNWVVTLSNGATLTRTSGDATSVYYTPGSTPLSTHQLDGQTGTITAGGTMSLPVGTTGAVSFSGSDFPAYLYGVQVTFVATDPEVTIAVSPASVSEDGATNLTYTVTRSAASASALTVNLTTAGTATSGTDFTGAATSVTIPANATTATVVLNPTVDGTVEPDETAIVTVASGSGYTVGAASSATGTILNDDVPSATIAVSPASVAEDGAPNLTYTITLNQAPVSATTVNFTVGGTATSGTDYAAVGTSASFAIGQTTATVVVNPTADATVEGDETVSLTLAAGAGYTVGVPNAATGTILNDDLPSASIAVSPSSVSEDGATNLTYTVTLSQAPASATTVNFTVGGTATDGTDYATIGTTAAFAIGQTTATVVVNPNVDGTVEADETVSLTLAAGTGYTVGAPSSATGTILNDDVPSATIAVSPASVAEDGAPNLVYTVTLNQASLSSTSVGYTISGTATNGTDYATIASPLVIPAGNLTGTITVNPIADATIESSETVTLTLAAGAGYTVGVPNAATGTILNDDLPNLVINDVTANEGNAGTTNFTFTVSLSAPAGPGGVTFDLATANGSATGGTDYVTQSLTGQTIPAGSSTYTFTVQVNGDALNEPSETFFANVTNVVNAVVVDGQGVGTIVNDDALPSLSINDVAVTEGASGTVSAVFTVSLTAASGQTVTVNYATANGTATAGSDYTAASGTLTFSPGATTRTITVTVAGDVAIEPDETFFVNLSGATNATIADNQGLGTVTNDDVPAASIAVSPASVSEDGATNLTYTVTLDQAPVSATTVNFTVAGTAVSGTDYAAVGTSASFAIGQTTATVVVNPTADATVEDDETVSLTLAAGTGYSIGAPSSATGTILNDDVPSASIAVSPASVSEDGATNLTYTITLAQAPTSATTVNFAVAGTATEGTDYAAIGTTAAFAVGQTSATVVVNPNVDGTVEADETVSLTLTAGSGYTVGAPASATGTILNDDVPSATIAVSPASVAEDGAPNLVYTVTLSQAPLSATTVNLTIAGTATNGADYGTIATTLGIPAGATTGAITVNPIADATVEADETVILTLAGGAGYTVGVPNAATGTILNDETPTLTIDDVTVNEGASGTTVATFTVSLSTPAPGGGVTFDVATANGTATAGSDYVARSLTGQVIPAGASTYSFDVTVNGDAFNEPTETALINVTNVTGATVGDGQGVLTITNDDAVPALSINDVTVVEGASGTVDAVFTVSLSAPSGQNVTVNYATANGTATAGSDYTAASGSLTFVPGETTRSIVVSVNGDALVEGDETFTVGLSAATNATIADATGVGTITNEDVPSVSIAVAPASATEDGATNLTYTLTLSQAPIVATTVNVTVGGTATGGTDYAAIGTSTAFAVGQTTATVVVDPTADAAVEADETVILTVASGTGYVVGAPAAATGTILNDDVPTLAIDDVTVNEGAAGTTIATFTVGLSAPAPAGGVTFDVATANGTATAGSDYVARSLTAQTIPAGAGSYSFDVTVNGDVLNEPTETAFVNVTNVTGATVIDGQGLLTIANDDALPTLSIDDVTVAEGASGSINAVFTVSLNGASGQTVTVNYATTNGTATAGSDYTAASGTLTFAPGQTTQSVSVAVLGDVVVEGDETFTVGLGGATNATIADASGLGTITNDDVLPTIAGLSPTSGPESGGTVVTISGANLTGATAVSFGGAPAGGFTVNGPGSITATAPPGTGTVDVIVTTPSGASVPTAGGRFTYVVAPTAANLSATAPYNAGGAGFTAIDLSAGAGGAVDAYVVGAPVNGSVVLVGSEARYTPPVGFGGTDTFTYSVSGPGGASSAATVTVTVAAPTIAVTTAGLSDGQRGVAYSATLAASGGQAPYVFTVSAGALPTGLTLSPAGVLSGTPQASGAFAFTVRAEDSSTGAGPYAGTRAYTLTIAAPVVSVSPAGGALPGGTVGAAYGQTLTATGAVAPYSFAVTAGALPPGVTLASDGTLSGTPTASGSYGFTVTATDSASAGSGGPYAGSATYSLVVGDAAPVATGSSLSVSYGAGPTNVPLTLSGGPTTSVAVSTAPTRGTVAVSGATLTYAPNAGAYGTDTFAYVASGPGGSSAPATVTVTIGAPTLVIGPAALADGQEDMAYSATLTASGGASPYAFVVTAGALPTGLTLSGTGALSGTPTAAGDYAFTVTVTDASTGAGPASASRAYTLRIGAPPPPVVQPLPGTVSAEGGASGGTPVRIDLSALVTGDFTEIRIATPPQNGTLVLEQQPPLPGGSGPRVTAVYTATAGYAGPDAFAFVAVGPGGTSAPATISITVAGAVPTAANLDAETEQGSPVTVDLTGAATEGPFTAATVVSVSPSGSATTSLAQGGTAGARTYQLTITPRADFEGQLVVTYTLSNAFGVSAPATVTVTVQARPDPADDPTVRALTTAQAQASRLFATTQLGNFNRRNEQLHGPGEGRGQALGVTVSSGLNGLWNGPLGDLPWTESDIRFAAERQALLNELPDRAGAADSRPEGSSAQGAEMLGVARSASGAGDGPRPVGSVEVWSGGTITVGGFDQTSRTASFDVTTSGVSAGADVKVSDQLTVGAGGGYGTQRSDIGEDEDGRLDGESWTGAIYGSWRPTPGAFVDGVLGYGSLNFDTRRLAANGLIANGERDGDMVMASVTGGWDRSTPLTTLSTYGRFDYVSTRLDAYSETGAGLYDLSFDEREFESLTGALGVRGQVLTPLRSGMLTQSGRFEWRHEFSGLDGQRLDYADVGGFRYAIDGERWARDEFAAELGLEVSYDSGLSLGIDLGARFSDAGKAASIRMLLAKRF